jgi:hypothetical protein
VSVFITCAIAAGVLLVALLRDIVYAQGYAHGRRDEQDWWSDLENATDEARKQIWREEARKGMWL